MLSPVWIATALGLLGGIVLTIAVAKAVVAWLVTKSRYTPMLAHLAFAGSVIALVPAIFLSLVIGGTLGGAWGEHAFAQFGLRSSGTPVGLALGISIVFAMVVVGGAAITVFAGKALVYYLNRKTRT